MHACDYLLACDMEMDPVPGYDFASWEKGYGDFRCVPDWQTLRRAAWLDRRRRSCSATSSTSPGASRSRSRRAAILQRQLARAREMGFVAQGGLGAGALPLPRDLRLGARRKRFARPRAVRQLHRGLPHPRRGRRRSRSSARSSARLDASGVPMEGSKGEWGPGQQEMNLRVQRSARAGRPQRPRPSTPRRRSPIAGPRGDLHGEVGRALAGSSHAPAPLAVGRDGEANLFPGDERLGPVACARPLPLLPRRLDRARGELRPSARPRSTPTSGFQSASFAPTAIAWSHRQPHGRASASSARDRRCASSAASRAPTRTPISPVPRARRGTRRHRATAPSRRRSFRATSTRPRRCRGFRRACARRSAGSSRAPWRVRRSARTFVDHYLHFLRTEQRKFDEAVTSWERERFFERG